jgi:hypothetical protein
MTQLKRMYWFRYLRALKLAVLIWRKPWSRAPREEPFDNISWQTARTVANGIWEVEL